MKHFINHTMITRHGRSSLSRCRNPLQIIHYDNITLRIGSQQARQFYASRPNLIINEALQLSSSLFYLVHDTSGLSWGLSVPLTAGLCQLAFTPLHYIIDRNRNIRSDGAELLAAYRTAFRDQILAQREGSGTEADAKEAEAHTKMRLKVKSQQIQQALGYKGIWLAFTQLLYIPLWVSNVSALVEMGGFAKEDSKVIAASGLNGVAVEPALTTDGMLWFTDLTIADPLCILPLTAGAFFYAAVLQIRRHSTGEPTRLQSVIETLAIISGPIFSAAGISNAVCLAMVGSTAMTMARRPILDRLLGSTTQVKPAQRKTAKLKKEYETLERG